MSLVTVKLYYMVVDIAVKGIICAVYNKAEHLSFNPLTSISQFFGVAFVCTQNA